jgi:hypothetical protein
MGLAAGIEDAIPATSAHPAGRIMTSAKSYAGLLSCLVDGCIGSC